MIEPAHQSRDIPTRPTFQAQCLGRRLRSFFIPNAVGDPEMHVRRLGLPASMP